ncbi:MAG: hypothetical protein WDM79_12285 [Terricaulis sp.]
MMIAAALLLPFALMQAEAAPLSGEGNARFAQCVTLIDSDAERAYEEAMAWAAEGHEVSAYRCAAMALVQQGRTAEGARRLESLAVTVSPEATGLSRRSSFSSRQTPGCSPTIPDTPAALSRAPSP